MLAISVDEILLAQSPQWQSTASPDQPTQSWLPKFGTFRPDRSLSDLWQGTRDLICAKITDRTPTVFLFQAEELHREYVPWAFGEFVRSWSQRVQHAWWEVRSPPQKFRTGDCGSTHFAHVLPRYLFVIYTYIYIYLVLLSSSTILFLS